MSKNVILPILLTMELCNLLAAMAVPDHSLAGKANDFHRAAQNSVHYRKARGLDEPPESEEANEETVCHPAGASRSSLAMASPSSSDNRQEGSAYGYTWVKFNGGVRLQGDSLLAIHLLEDHEIDTTKHGFPYIQAKIVPPKVNMNDDLEVWYQGSLHPVKVESHLLITSKFGGRILWGAVPAFKFDYHLIPGSPIFRDGKLVSIITKSDGRGKYAVSGISEVSGHFASHKVRARTMTAAQSVYGGFIGSYAEIKEEATREKGVGSEIVHYEIVVGVNTLRLVGWKGDNVETFHTRIGSVPDLTCGEC